MSLQGHAAVKFVTGRRLTSSSGRGWTNMLAERWSHAVGELPSILPRDTEIAVLLSGGTLVERQGPGLPQRTLARRGSVWLCPSGIPEDFINIRQPVDLRLAGREAGERHRVNPEHVAKIVLGDQRAAASDIVIAEKPNPLPSSSGC